MQAGVGVRPVRVRCGLLLISIDPPVNVLHVQAAIQLGEFYILFYTTAAWVYASFTSSVSLPAVEIFQHHLQISICNCFGYFFFCFLPLGFW